jgi:hypothetical protein
LFLSVPENPAEIWTFPNLFQRWSSTSLPLFYLTKNVQIKISSGQYPCKGFFDFFCEFVNLQGFCGVFADIWQVEKGDRGQKFGEDRGVEASVGCGVLGGKKVHKHDFRPEIAVVQGVNREHGMIDGTESIWGNDNDSNGRW